MSSEILISIAKRADLSTVLAVEGAAFGEKQGKEIVELVENLLNDSTAEPRISLLARVDGQPVGHILFTSARLRTEGEKPVISLLAPLAVIAEAQNQGIGGRLIKHGLELLRQAGTDLVFVLGHPGYYPRYGFQPAGVFGFEAPYPIPEKDANAWMVLELTPDSIERFNGKVICAEAIDQPEYWVE